MDADLLRTAVERAVDYLDHRDARPVAPSGDAVSQLEELELPIAELGRPALEVLKLLDDVGSPGTVVSNGPRYFGFVTGGAQPVAQAASILGAAWDQNGATPVMSPTGATIDRSATAAVIDLLGLPTSATAVFCGGATVANLIGITAARDSVLAGVGWDVPGQGLAGAPPVTVIAGEEAHASLKKAVGLAGLGRDRLVTVPTDHQGRMMASRLPAIDGPTIVALQAGNVNTGHSDPFAEIVPAAKDAGAWIHVDGAFGLWAAASARRRDQVAGAELADSFATDAHKWLNVTYDSAVAIVADGRNLIRSMQSDAAYLMSDVEIRVPMHLGIQMSQRVRALEVWAVLQTLGRSGLAELIDGSCDLAERFAARLSAGGAEVLNDVVLNQALVAFGDDEATDEVISAVQAEGTCWVGGTVWNGRRAMRLSVSAWETSNADIDLSADAILACWQAITARRDPSSP